jgi:hypothetical protein
MYFDTFINGNEAINYQIGSKFKTDLTAFFQDCIDATNQIKNEVDAKNLKTEDAWVEKYKKISEYFKSKCAKRFCDIIEKHTCLEIKDLRVIGGPSYVDIPTCAFAVYLDIGGVSERMTYDMLARMGGTSIRNTDSVNDALDKIREAAVDVENLETSKLNKTEIKTSSNVRIGMFVTKMVFDVNAAFLSDRWVSYEKVPALTAAELCAIMMHEVGHAMTVIEHFGTAYYFERLRTNFDVTLANSSAEELKDSYQKLKKTIMPEARKRLRNFQNKTLANAAGKVLDTAELAGDNLIKHADDVIVHKSNRFLLVLFSSIFMTIVKTSLYIFYFPFVYLFFISIDFNINADEMNDIAAGRKTSDTANNNRNMFNLERWADQFATRHGCGADLATGLDKIETIFSAIDGASGAGGYAMTGWAFNIACAFDWFWSLFTPMYYSGPVIYETTYGRFKRIAEDAKSVFKNSDSIPKYMLSEWIHTVETAEESAEKYRRWVDTPFGSAVANVINTLANPVRWANILIDANLKRDVSILEDNLAKLNNNKLFMLSTKLKM